MTRPPSPASTLLFAGAAVLLLIILLALHTLSGLRGWGVFGGD